MIMAAICAKVSSVLLMYIIMTSSIISSVHPAGCAGCSGILGFVRYSLEGCVCSWSVDVLSRGQFDSWFMSMLTLSGFRMVLNILGKKFLFDWLST